MNMDAALSRRAPAKAALADRNADVPLAWTRTQGVDGIHDRCVVDDYVLSDSFTAPVVTDRNMARILIENSQQYVFSINLQGDAGLASGLYKQSSGLRSGVSILASDLNQPMRIQRPAGRLLTLLAPSAAVESIFADADALHGRTLDADEAHTRRIVDQLWRLRCEMPMMSTREANEAIRGCLQLIVWGFVKQARLSGSPSATARAAVFARVRSYIKSNLHQPDLSAENILKTLQLPRLPVYRMFEHEGGLESYIRTCRLHEAANELAHFPMLAIKDVAYAFGFNHIESFNRAFRRAYNISPQELRTAVLIKLRKANNLIRRML